MKDVSVFKNLIGNRDIDFYTFNFDYLGTRTTGNGGGTYLIAGPGWRGETPKGIAKVVRSETEIIMPAIRTQLFNPGDMSQPARQPAAHAPHRRRWQTVEPGPAARVGLLEAPS